MPYMVMFPINANNEKLVSVALKLDVKNTNGYPNTSVFNSWLWIVLVAKADTTNSSILTNNMADTFFVIGFILLILMDSIFFEFKR